MIDPTGSGSGEFRRDRAVADRRTARRTRRSMPARCCRTESPINGVVELRAQLVDRPATFAQTVTERLMMYAVNRQLEYFDMPQVRAIVRGAAKDNYKLSSIVLGIVNSDAFRKQGPAAVETDSAPKLAAQVSGSQEITCSSPRSTFPAERC